jgi:hypothetical protein
MKLRGLIISGRSKILYLLCILSFLTQCSLEDEIDIQENLKLSRITLNGVAICNYSYDDQGRPTLIKTNLGDLETFEISYDPLRITDTEYLDGVKNNYTVYTNIKLNSNGYIESRDYSDYEYWDEGGWTCVMSGHETFTYDSSGHLIKSEDSSEDVPVIYQWKDGKLISGESDEGKVTYTYHATPNTQDFWSLASGTYELGLVPGLFGKLPVQLVETETGTDEGEYFNRSYAYQFSESGYIEKVKVYEDGETYIMNYYYTK